VVLESWIDRGLGLARVRYRGTTWDARVTAGAQAEPGATLIINGQDGSTLLVSAAPVSN
jgi:membrane protein implicated in regulation of membrane protease activity